MNPARRAAPGRASRDPTAAKSREWVANASRRPAVIPPPQPSELKPPGPRRAVSFLAATPCDIHFAVVQDSFDFALSPPPLKAVTE